MTLKLQLLLALGLMAAAPTQSYAALPGSAPSSAVPDPRHDSLVAVSTLREAVELRLLACCSNTFKHADDLRSRSDIAARIAALESTSEFARIAAQGMTIAVQDPIEQLRISSALVLEIAEIDRRVQERLFDLLSHPAVGAQGWFVTSRFGAEAEAQAGSLLRRADVWGDALEALERRVADLVTRGEASPDTHRRIAALLAGEAYAGRDLASIQ